DMHEVTKFSGKPYTNISFVYDNVCSKFVYVDNSFATFVGISEGKLTKEFLLGLIHPDDRNYAVDKFREFQSQIWSGSLEFRIQLASEIHWVRLTPFLLRSDASDLIAVNVQDITSEWNNMDSIRRYTNKKNSILNMLAHDLRGPLDIAHTLTKTVDKHIDDPSLLKMTRSISVILSQSIQMIADLLGRELHETVEVELSMKRLNIVKKISEYLEECRKSEASADRVFNLTSSAKSIYIDLDEAKFMQIMNNLVTNALKFTHPGGVIEVDILEKANSVLFSFGDNGIGIPEEFHSELFDKFTRARRKGLNGEPTLGLGLSIVKTIVEWHNGRVWVESQENTGTKFFFELPKVNTSGATS
ncbi:MAG: HAMP domain-containing sensor histidine kinase, partial [Bacteroidota bacterium]